MVVKHVKSEVTAQGHLQI